MVLSTAEPYDRPAATWFVGDVSPRGSMLPSVVGTARLVRRAKAEGAQTVVIDTTGLIEGQPGLVLKYHKAIAAGVDAVVALQRESELELLLGMLGGLCPAAHRLPVAPETQERSAAQRTQFRQERYAAYFDGSELLRVETARLLDVDWSPDPVRRQKFPLPGAIVGLLDAEDFCLGIGLVEKLLPGKLVLFTPWTDPDAVVRMRLGKIRLDRQAGYAEIHASD
jgi:polynucleotide 5'-kinase involved in rRNA processing